MSCKDVCLSGDYDESADFYRERFRKAAKPHDCCECGRVIEKGERYRTVSGKWDGDFAQFDTCAECAEIQAAFGCNGYSLTTLWEDVRDEIFPRWDEMKAIDCLAKLTTEAAIAKMRAEYARFVEDRS